MRALTFNPKTKYARDTFFPFILLCCISHKLLSDCSVFRMKNGNDRPVLLNLASVLSGSINLSLNAPLHNFQLHIDEDKACVELYLHVIVRHSMELN